MKTTTNQRIIKDCNRRLVGLRAEIADTEVRYAGKPGGALMLKVLREDEARLNIRIHLHT